MIVHFAGSRYRILENIDRLKRFIQVIENEGHTLADRWLDDAIEGHKNSTGEHPDIDWHKAHKNSVESVNRADVVIADATIRSFSVGYQVAIAVQMKKPVLVLSEEGTDSFFASGIEAGIIYKTYQEHTVEGIIRKFLEDNDIKAKDMRFNFFIDRPIYNYLRWAAFKTGKTKAEILRELVTREIDNKKDF